MPAMGSPPGTPADPDCTLMEHMATVLCHEGSTARVPRKDFLRRVIPLFAGTQVINPNNNTGVA